MRTPKPTEQSNTRDDAGARGGACSLSELAEQVLFGCRLEDKLVSPSSFDDSRRGEAIVTPRMPGRPQALALEGSRSRAAIPFPSVHEISNEQVVGRILHFFANHELLAMELMALVLLKFPDAPAGFRRGVAHTMLEEQEHMRLYRARMKMCGVDFGEIPVNDYFWRAISPMASPVDYVTQMSLTFEQANLDFSLQYAQAFEQIGDAQSAALMQRVYEDEIGHVEHGLVWFQRWLDEEEPHESTFDAYTRLLPEPLTPRRAKGQIYSVSARKRAGFDADFIERLEVYSASRGRAPDVFVFNPNCEAEIVYGAGHTPKTSLSALARDLETLPALIAGTDDVVLVHKAPSITFLRTLQQAGVSLPQFVEPGALTHDKLRRFRPWGWSPAVLRQLEPLAPRCHHPLPVWSPARAELYSKALGVRLLSGLGSEVPDVIAGRVFTDAEAVERRLAELYHEHGYLWSVVKAPWGASGRDMLRVREGTLLGTGQEGWLRNTLKRQGAVVVEPWLERVCDLSIQFRISADAVHIDGITRFAVDLRGQYRGHHVGRWTHGLPPEVLRFIHGTDVEAALSRAARHAAPTLREAGFEGVAGIDAFIYRAADGALCLKPLVELNPRLTMGHVALGLKRLLARSVVATWRLVRLSDVMAAGFTRPADYAEHLRAAHPLIRDACGRLLRGVLFTTDPERAETVLSVLCVGAPPASIWF